MPFMKMPDKYKPIGLQWVRVTEVKGKPIYSARSDFESLPNDLKVLESKLKDVEKEYGGKAKIVSEQVTHGSSNRDGQSTERQVTHYSIRVEVPEYSHKDFLEATIEQFTNKYGPKIGITKLH